ncbi:MAG: sulfite exporter TauE/SafE family protein [Treponema sp.]|nr:sulfite exporter TauE/SafE family protein [Treponema sp.]
MITIVLGVLILFGIIFLAFFVRDMILHKEEIKNLSWIKCGILGFITNALNVLGIGSFATITAGLRLMKQTDDRLIPGTLNVSCTIPVILQAIVFIKAIEVDPVTLICMFASAIAGSYLGARIVVKLSEQLIRLVMGIALFIAAFLLLAGKFGWLPAGGDTFGISGGKLIVAATGNFFLGALMTAGIGLYGPCMALVYLLGMSPAAAFPIMMGSCAFLLPVASFKFMREGAYDRRSSLVLQISGTAGILTATFVLLSLPIEIFRWIVIIVLIYTSFNLLVTFYRKRR